MSEDELNITPYEELPFQVREIINDYDENDNDDYKQLSQMQKELKTIGWFMEFYLDAQITELRPMTKE